MIDANESSSVDGGRIGEELRTRWMDLVFGDARKEVPRGNSSASSSGSFML
jgi:hypothetical protein